MFKSVIVSERMKEENNDVLKYSGMLSAINIADLIQIAQLFLNFKTHFFEDILLFLEIPWIYSS